MTWSFRRQPFCSLITGEVEGISSQLAKQIWKCSKRSIRSPDIWSNFSKQIISNSAYLTPRDVSVVVQSFARISYRDEKMLSSIVPLILKHVNEFSVRELVTILSSFRKLEVEKSRTIPSSCIHLIVNEITIRSSEWTSIDVPLIANSVAWFSIFEESVWKKIERKTLRLIREISPLGLSLIVTSLAKLDIRNERILGAVSRAFTKPSESSESANQEPMKQESLATLINGFGKLDWNPRGLFDYIESELIQILSCQVGASFFDTQSKILVLHALFAHRYRYLGEVGLTDNQVVIFESLTQGLVKKDLNSDQAEKLSQIVAILDGRRYEEIETSLKMLKSSVLRFDGEKNNRPKLPRWEYEVFRVLRDKMHAKVKKIKIGNSGVIIMDSVDNGIVVINCLGPFQHYTGSTKRTSASWIRKEAIQWKLRQDRRKDVIKFIEIPFYIWNELKTDKDKIMFLMSRGRQAADDKEQVS